jgi:hypothetical protein
VKNFIVKLYQKSDYEKWNAFISKAKNATFLFHRDFMEYHKDRFQDYSLMVYDDEKLIAVLPANKVGDSVHSHQGLTFGGVIYDNAVNGEKAELILDSLLAFLIGNSIDVFYLKQIPPFYLLNGNAEIDFFLIQRGAVLYRKEMNLGINLSMPLSVSKSKLKHFRKIDKLDLEIVEQNDLTPFWNQVLIPRLLEKHKANPVHTLKEITFLKESFPENIKQYSVYYKDEILAGITIFMSNNIVKSQYGATTQKGEQMRAMDYLFIKLIEKYKQQGIHFFDMGIVGENNERGYNPGLLKQKEELGCTIYNQDFYKLELL